MSAALRAVVFDAYGTLLDVHAAVGRHAVRLGTNAAALSALWRQKQLEYTWILSAAGDYEPFDAITDRALGHAMAVHGLDDGGLRADLLAAYRSLDAYPDAAATIGTLRAAGLGTAVLSNGEPKMLGAALAHAGLAPLLDRVLSVDPLRCYKPAPRVYRLACEAFGCQPHEIGFVSANAWDTYGAARFGFRVFWLNRAGGPSEYWLDGLATPISGLSALPQALAS
jgi:2-haloacid dehalogenase